MKLKSYFFLLLLVAQPLRAGAVLTLDQSVITGLAGNTLTFSGTITNTGGQELFLNGISFTLGSSELAFEPTAFFNLVPASLAIGSSYSGQLFGVMASATIPSGDYGGSVGFLGGLDPFTAEEVLSADFTVRISTEVPEPNTFGLTVVILAAISLWQIKRKRTTATA